MAIIFTHGLMLAASVFIGLVFTLIGLFFGHIILFDSIFLAVITGIVCNRIGGIHSAISVVIGVTLLAILFWIQNTKVGFWIIGMLLSLFWAFVFGFLAYVFSSQDMVWFYVVFGLGFIIMAGLHLHAKSR